MENAEASDVDSRFFGDQPREDSVAVLRGCGRGGGGVECGKFVHKDEFEGGQVRAKTPLHRTLGPVDVARSTNER